MKKMLSVILDCSLAFALLPVFSFASNTVSVDDLVFELNEGGQSYSVVGCIDGISGDLVIPSEYKGLPVTNVGEYAFTGQIGLDSVTFPSSMEYIGEGAFFCCDGFVARIVMGYDNDENESEGLKKVCFCGGNANIGAGSFSGCTKLEKVDLNGVKKIGREAFSGCYNLKQLVIPDTVTEICENAFSALSCESLCELLECNVPEECKNECVKEIMINGNQTIIHDEAFAYCTGLEMVIVNGVSEVCSDAFKDCKALKKIVIQNSCVDISKLFSALSTMVFFCEYGSNVYNDAKNNNCKYSAVDQVNKVIVSNLYCIKDYNEVAYIFNNMLSVIDDVPEYFGTGSVIKATDSEMNEYTYRVIICGDLDGDSVCDVTDAVLAERIVSNHIDATENQAYAANGCISDDFNVASYQNVVNMALA